MRQYDHSRKDASGGFEVRRKDWEKLKERLGRYTAFQWNHRMIYMVCVFFSPH